MREAMLARVDGAAMVVMTAAVADYRPDGGGAAEAQEGRARRRAGDGADPEPRHPRRAARDARRCVVGFAAETEDVERHAAEKLAQKGCDLHRGQRRERSGIGLRHRHQPRGLLARDGSVERLPLLTKDEVADRILDRARALLRAGAEACA